MAPARLAPSPTAVSWGAPSRAPAAAAAAQNGGAFPHWAPPRRAAAAAVAARGARDARAVAHVRVVAGAILGRLWAPTQTPPGGFGTSDSPHLGTRTVGSAFRDRHASGAGTRTVVGGGAYVPAEVAELSAILAPAVAALADLDLSTSDLHVGFGDAGGFGDGGRLKGLIRRTRDTLLAAVPANAGEPPTLLLARGERNGGSHDGVSPARGFAQSPLPPPRFGLFNA